MSFAASLTGCGATTYAGMTRAASGQTSLEDASNTGELEHGAAQARVPGARGGANGQSRPASNIASPTESQPLPVLASAEAALVVRPISSLRWRRQVTLQSLRCANQSMTGAGTTTCTVTLNSGAPAGGVVVALSSNNTALSVPSSILVPSGATSATFSAVAAAVSAGQSASIRASANGSSASFGIQLNAVTPSLAISSTTVSFGAVNVGQTATNIVTLTSSGNAPLTISSISVAGSLFQASGINTPLTLNPGQSAALTLQFYSDHTSSYTGVVTITSNSTQGAATINLSADGVPSVSGLTCSTQSYTGQGTDSCLVSLYGAAPYTGFTVSLASNNSSATVPPSVTVPSGAMSASFSASVSNVSTNQTATLTASAGGIAKSFAIQLTAGNTALTANASSIPFGSVLFNSPAEQSITLTASGSLPVTINSIAITGAGFADSGLAAPIVLNPGQTAILNVEFTPTTSGNFSGQITIGSNANGGTISIGLSGTGYGHTVQLNWNASSSNTVIGYNIYRVISGSTGYQRMNSAAVSTTGYTDAGVQSGSSYTYYVTSVDGSGTESVPSNMAAVAVPTP